MRGRSTALIPLWVGSRGEGRTKPCPREECPQESSATRRVPSLSSDGTFAGTICVDSFLLLTFFLIRSKKLLFQWASTLKNKRSILCWKIIRPAAIATPRKAPPITSIGKCAPTYVLEKETSPASTVRKAATFLFPSVNHTTVIKAQTTKVCPEGKLGCDDDSK